MHSTQWQIRVDDLSSTETRALVTEHLAGMHAQSPAESVHALGIEQLQDPAITLYSAWTNGELGGIVALKRLDGASGEIKSMRTTLAARGQGLGRKLLLHVIAEAQRARLTELLLETGSSDDFLPARSLYASEGFLMCDSFGDYESDPESIFMRLPL